MVVGRSQPRRAGATSKRGSSSPVGRLREDSGRAPGRCHVQQRQRLTASSGAEEAPHRPTHPMQERPSLHRGWPRLRQGGGWRGSPSRDQRCTFRLRCGCPSPEMCSAATPSAPSDPSTPPCSSCREAPRRLRPAASRRAERAAVLFLAHEPHAAHLQEGSEKVQGRLVLAARAVPPRTAASLAASTSRQTLTLAAGRRRRWQG